MPEQQPLGDRENRRRTHDILRWLRVAFAISWALSFAFGLIVFILLAKQGPIDWLLLLGLIVLGCTMLPFGLFILRRIEAVLARSCAGAEEQAEGARKDTKGRTERLLMGLFGLILVGAGLVGGLRGTLYEGRGPFIRSFDAPVTAWLLGAILIVAGLCLISVVFAKPPKHTDECTTSPSAARA